VAARLGEYLQLGMALDVMWSEVTLKQFYPWFLGTGNLADPDGRIKAEGDGVGVGGKVGLTLQLTERQRIALTYRLPMNIDYDGGFQVDNVPAGLGGGTFRTDFKTTIKFPTIIAAGYGINLTDKIRIEADVEWLQFSRFKDLPLIVANGLPGLPASVHEDWRDTFTIGIGGDWRINEHWVVRAGYQFYQSPVPDSTFSPTIPDADQNVITVGVGYTYKKHSIEAADFYDKRHIENNQNPAFNGNYDITVHLFSFSYRFTF
jgi:long-chain fatty acid transport protein